MSVSTNQLNQTNQIVLVCNIINDLLTELSRSVYSGTSWECGGLKRSRMRSCGSVQSKRGLKSPYGEENGDGLVTL